MTTDEADIPPDIAPGQVLSNYVNTYVVISVGHPRMSSWTNSPIFWVTLMDSAGDTIDRTTFYVHSAMTPV